MHDFRLTTVLKVRVRGYLLLIDHSGDEEKLQPWAMTHALERFLIPGSHLSYTRKTMTVVVINEKHQMHFKCMYMMETCM